MRDLLLMALSLLMLVQLAAETTYFVLFETLAGGRSPGKMLVGLRVVSDDGRAIGVPQAIARNLLRFIDVLPTSYLVGLAAILVSPQGKRLGDLAAGTIVVRLDRPPVADEVDDAPRPNDEVFVFDHRQSRCIGAAEVHLARETLRRAAGASEDLRPRLLRSTVDGLRARLGYGPVDPEQHEAFLRAVLRAARKRRGA
jgi:hypothetical protein